MPELSERKHAARHLVAAVLQEPWMLHPAKLEQMCELLALREQGLVFTREEVAARIGAQARRRSEDDGEEDPPRWQLVDGVAVLPLFGMLTPRMNLFQAISGGTSTQQFAGWFREALGSAKVKAIVLDVDSPGGSTQGNAELADLMFQARGAKPIVAVGTNLLASAAYYIASAAEQLVASPSTQVGSIGTYMVHREASRMAENAGIKYTLVKAGENKALGLDIEPLTAQSRAYLQERVDEMQALFVRTVARNRGLTVEGVNERYGQGKDVIASTALAMGMIDRVATLDQVVNELRSRASPAARGSGAGTRQQATANTGEARTNMDPRIKAALVKQGLVKEDTSDEAAQVVLQAWFAGRGQTVPEKTDEVLAALETKPPKQKADPPADPPSGQTKPPVDPEKVRKEGRAEERQRITEIQIAAEALGIDEKQVQAAVDSDMDIHQVRAKFISLVKGKEDPVAKLEAGKAAIEKITEQALAGLCERFAYLGVKHDFKGQNDLRYASTLDMARLYLESAGVRTMGKLPEEIAQMALETGETRKRVVPRAGLQAGEPFARPGDYPNLLSALAGKMLDAAQQTHAGTYRNWAKRIDSVPDFKPKQINRVGEIGELDYRPDGAPATQVKPSTEANWFAVDPYADKFGLTPRMIVDDDLGAFADAMAMFVDAGERTMNRLAINLLTGNATAGDGVALFHANHSNIVSGGGVPAIAQLNKMRILFRRQLGVSAAARLNLTLESILVAPANEEAAAQLLNPTRVAQPTTDATINVYRGEVRYFVEPMIEDVFATGVEWYGFAPLVRAAAVIYGFMRGYDGGGGRSEQWYDPDSGCRWISYEVRGAAAVNNWRGVVQNTGS